MSESLLLDGIDSPEDLRRLPREQVAQVAAELRTFPGPVQEYLQAKNPAWNVMGRVCFHLAENRANPEAPFAFVATYAKGVSKQGRVQHAQLGKAAGHTAEEADLVGRSGSTPAHDKCQVPGATGSVGGGQLCKPAERRDRGHGRGGGGGGPPERQQIPGGASRHGDAGPRQGGARRHGPGARVLGRVDGGAHGAGDSRGPLNRISCMKGCRGAGW